MRRVALALAVAVALPAPTLAEPDRRATHLAAIAVGVALYASSETFFKDAISPDACRWCAANGFDRNIREAFVWGHDERAVFASNVTGYLAAPLAPMALLALSSTGPGRFDAFIDDAIPVLEATTAVLIATQIVKVSVARQRPYAHFDPPATASAEDNLSFFSGHSAFTMAIAVSAGTVASRRGYRHASAIWITGLSLAAATMYLRIAGDRHYATDVFVGAAVGAAGGFAVPLVTGALPPRARLVPSAGGVSVVGTF